MSGPDGGPCPFEVKPREAVTAVQTAPAVFGVPAHGRTAFTIAKIAAFLGSGSDDHARTLSARSGVSSVTFAVNSAVACAERLVFTGDSEDSEGLQNHPPRFESGRRLQINDTCPSSSARAVPAGTPPKTAPATAQRGPRRVAAAEDERSYRRSARRRRGVRARPRAPGARR